MVTKLIAVTTLQYIQISNHYIVHLKLICQLDTVLSKETLIIPTSQGYCVNDNDNNSNSRHRGRAGTWPHNHPPDRPTLRGRPDAQVDGGISIKQTYQLQTHLENIAYLCLCCNLEVRKEQAWGLPG